MHFLQKNSIKIIFKGCLLVLLFLVASCEGVFRKNPDAEPVARVGDSYLYKDDISALFGNKTSKQDSITFVTNYINNWAAKQLLISKAKINLPEEKLAEFDALVANYRTDLYTRAYKEALVQQEQDTIISDTELKEYYEREKQNFKLKEKLVSLRFIELPKQFMDKKAVADKLKAFNEEDKMYLDSIGVQFKKLNFNDSVWVKASRIIKEIPPLTPQNQDLYLKKSQFFELQDSLGVYLTKVTNVLNINDIAPLPFVEPSIKQVILNRRRLSFLNRLETEVIDEAIKNKEFEIYEKDE